MPEKCVNDPGRECKSATRLALLEKRVESLETGQQKESKFREAYYTEQKNRIERDAHLDEKINSMDEKLDKLVAWKEEDDIKPAKRWDSLIDKAIWAVAAAVITFFLAKVGL